MLRMGLEITGRRGRTGVGVRREEEREGRREKRGGDNGVIVERELTGKS